MIAWLVVSSEAMRATDASRGLSRRDIWDLRGLIRDWYYSYGYYLVTPNVSDVFQGFCNVMTTHGHTCHIHYDSYDPVYSSRHLKKWIWMQSVLDPSQCHGVVYLSLAEDSPCPPCAAQAQLLASSVDALNIQYQPPYHLVFLWILWTTINSWDISKWLERLNRMACQNSSPLLKISTLKFVDSWLDKLQSETTDEKFLPWVNFLPQSWWNKCTYLTLHDWQQAETSIQATTGTLQETQPNSSFDTHDFSTLMDIRIWIGSVLFLMLTTDDAWNPDPFIDVDSFIAILDNYQEILSIPSLPDIQPTTAVINIRHATKESCHTCYKKYSPASLDWYASVVALTNGAEYTKFMPFVGDDSCMQCRIARSLCALIRGGEPSSSTERQLNVNRVLQELVTVTAREGLRIELPRGNSRSEWLSSPAEENPVISLNRSGVATSEIIHSSSRITSCSYNQKRSSRIEPTSKSGTIRTDGVGAEPKALRRPKGFMIKEIKHDFIKLLENIGVPIPGVKAKQLPWTTLHMLLEERGWELDNWPAGVPQPGSGDQSCDDNKGINGLDTEHLRLLYDAMKSEAYPLGFRRIVDAATSAATSGSQISDRSTSADEDRGSTDPNQAIRAREYNSSRKRRRGDHNVGDVETHLRTRPRTSFDQRNNYREDHGEHPTVGRPNGVPLSGGNYML